jgi:hypothetical protein
MAQMICCTEKPKYVSKRLVLVEMLNSDLFVGIHSDSLKKANEEYGEVVDTFLKCSEFDGISMLATPTTDSKWSTSYKRISHLNYEDHGGKSFVAKYKTLNAEKSVLFYDTVPREMISEPYGCQTDSTEFKEIECAFHDLLAFEAISRNNADSILVSQSPYLLEKNVWIQKRFEVKILSFLQALEYIDLYLRRNDSTFYYVAPHHTIRGGNASYYWFLLRDLLQAFTDAWSISVFGADIIQNGRRIQKMLQGFASKFENAFYSSDRITIEYMKRPNNSTQWEMLYNLNYFCMLVTGIFDLLAWLTVYRYSMPIHQPYQVSIHITNHKSKGARFVSAVAKNNPPLASFIAMMQDFIHMFYPMRDSIQHRQPVGGAQFEQANEGWTVSLATLEQDAFDSVKIIDKAEQPFTKFGLLNIGIPNLMEPHRFTRRALRELIAFSNTYIELLDFPSLVATHQDLIDRLAQLAPTETYTPFVPKIYWKRNTHLPIMFRNR